MATIELSDELVEGIRSAKGQEEFYDSGFSSPGSFGLRVGKGGRKAFFLVYKYRGKRKRLTLGSFPLLDVDTARQMAHEALSLAAEGRDPKFEFARRATAPRVSDFYDVFLSECREDGLAQRTIEEYSRILQREVLPVLGGTLMRTVEEEELRKLLEKVAIVRGSLVMSNRVRSVLRSFFARAAARGVITRSPAENLSAPTVEGGAQKYLELEDLRALWTEADHQLEPLRSALKILLLTAQRPGDVLSMQWDDIDVDAWILRRKRRGETRYFEVPLPTISLAILREAKSRQRAGVGDKVYVFSSGPKNRLTFIRRAAQRIGEKLGFAWCPSDIRRSAARLLLLNGVQPLVVKYLVGNAPPKGLAPEDTEELHRAAREALGLWSRLLTAPTESPKGPRRVDGKGAKVIPLFS
ncbi:MAG: integrase family protein [Bdellovibrionales bacterium]|nr:integrase family protein [Bdellovibrionales bacterium]